VPANIDASRIQDAIKDLDDGVYFGYSKVVGKDDSAQPMVMSIGQNITFADAKNKTAV
jgi:FAD synthase